MCFHTSQTKKVTTLENRFKVTLHKVSLRPVFDNPAYHLNGFAHPEMLIILQEEPSVLVPGKWGIVPQNKKRDQLESYYKEAVKFGGGLNAQSEKLFNHFLYKQLAITRRCIIPVTGFYEPHDHKGKKYPFYISRKDEDSIGLAGIYTLIEGLSTFSILTQKATPLFEKIHNQKKRQPILLQQSYEQQWLSDNLNEQDITSIINNTYPEQELNPYTVSKDLFSPKINSNTPEIINRVTYQDVTIN
ncbi:MAG: SOS response-associated peptidase family protein [Flavobacteriaceae bacterium]